MLSALTKSFDDVKIYKLGAAYVGATQILKGVEI
jgi:hypothetical protein